MNATTEETFKKAAESFAHDQPQQDHRLQSGSRVDVAKYLGHYAIPFKVKQNGTGTLYCLETCLFDPSHVRESSIIQGADGVLRYQCFHNSCKGHTWNEARELISGDNSLKPFMEGQEISEPDTKIRGLPEPAPEYRLTELGNAERFADQHKDNVRYVSLWKKWIYYDGKRWSPGADEKVRQLAHQTAKGFYTEAAGEPDREKAARLAKWGAASCRSASISAMLKEAAALLAIDPSTLDADPWLFNCDNVTLDIRSLTERPHCRADFITKITTVTFDPIAKAPMFERALARCLPRTSIEYVQRFFGYCLTGSTVEQIINIWHGDGANGKTTLLTPLVNALGDYAQTTRPETLMVKRSDGIPSDLAKLKGARLVTAAEAEDGHRLAESAIKQMTGGDKIQARALYQDWFEFTPEFKILLCTNHKPIITGIDHAIWRRIRLVPFTETIPEPEQDKHLPEKLNGELSGILNWILTGAMFWLANGLGYPEEVREATATYQSEQSVINVFLDGCCVVRADAMAEAGLLFNKFEQWRTNEGHRKITQTKFGRMLAQLGFKKDRLTGSGRMFYRGLGINEH